LANYGTWALLFFGRLPDQLSAPGGRLRL